MEAVTVSSKYQIVIPKDIRKEIKAKPGMQYWIFTDGDGIKLIPKKDIQDLFGTLKDIDSNIEREEEDRI